MQELKDRIVQEGKVLPGNIIKVDGFLNHRIDTVLMDHIAETVLFPYAAVFAGLAFVTMACVKHGDAKPDAKKELAALDVDD